MIDVVGWIGSFLLAWCGPPQAVCSIKQKHSDGLSWSFLLMWFFGEVFLLVYILPKQDLPLIFNYSINIFCLTIIVYFKIFGSKGPKLPL